MTTPISDMNEQHLEPRVARLETGLETLTRNVSEMAVSMRENSMATNNKIDTLVVAVTNAQAPKKTDWTVIIAALGLALAIGAAVFVPLNNATTDNKVANEKMFTVLADHMKLNLHPVGEALVKRLEEQQAAHATSNEKALKEHMDRDKEEYFNLDKKLQLEYSLINAKMETQLQALDSKIQLEIKLQNEISRGRDDSYLAMQQQFNDKIYGRVVVLEQLGRDRDQKDLDELRLWRMKANGLSSPTMAAPLIPKELINPK